MTERATPVLEQARSWAELTRGLAEHGLSIRVKGGGITLTDGRHEAKASDVGRAFSRGRLEKRFGSYPDYRARMAVASAIAPAGRAVLPTREQPRVPSAATISSPAPELAASAPVPPASVPAPQTGILGRRRPQFGDAGHGIAELFGYGEAPAPERPAPAPERAALAGDRTFSASTEARTARLCKLTLSDYNCLNGMRNALKKSSMILTWFQNKRTKSN